MDWVEWLMSDAAQVVLTLLLFVMVGFLILRVILIAMARARRDEERQRKVREQYIQHYSSTVPPSAPFQPGQIIAPPNCPHCGAALAANQRFCTRCGKPALPGPEAAQR